jgi:hypothetical protein
MKLTAKAKQYICSILFLMLFINLLQASDDNFLNNIDQAYKSFNYDEVIILCQKALQDTAQSNPETLVDIYRFMGLSYYALGEMGPSYNKFHLLLTLNPRYQLDPSRTPPKVLRFFNEIKATFKERPDKSTITRSDTVFFHDGPGKSSLIYSFILPGSGHVHEGFKTKGWILTSSALVALGSSIYFIFETNNREKNYLNAVEKDIIEQKYQEYNDAYRMRNLSLGLFAGVWLYSQIDLLFISSYEQNYKSGLSIHAGIYDTCTPSIFVTYRF